MIILLQSRFINRIFMKNRVTRNSYTKKIWQQIDTLQLFVTFMRYPCCTKIEEAWYAIHLFLRFFVSWYFMKWQLHFYNQHKIFDIMNFNSQLAHDVWRFWKVCSIVNVNVLISFKVKDTFSHWCGFYISSVYSHFITLSKQRQIHFTRRRCFIQLHFSK